MKINTLTLSLMLLLQACTTDTAQTVIDEQGQMPADKVVGTVQPPNRI